MSSFQEKIQGCVGKRDEPAPGNMESIYNICIYIEYEIDSHISYQVIIIITLLVGLIVQAFQDMQFQYPYLTTPEI